MRLNKLTNQESMSSYLNIPFKKKMQDLDLLERPSRSLQSKSKYWLHWPSNLKTCQLKISPLFLGYSKNAHFMLTSNVLNTSVILLDIYSAHWPLAHSTSWSRWHPEWNIGLQQQLEHEVVRGSLCCTLCLTQQKELLKGSISYVSIRTTHQNINNKVAGARQGIKGCWKKFISNHEARFNINAGLSSGIINQYFP